MIFIPVVKVPISAPWEILANFFKHSIPREAGQAAQSASQLPCQEEVSIPGSILILLISTSQAAACQLPNIWQVLNAACRNPRLVANETSCFFLLCPIKHKDHTATS